MDIIKFIFRRVIKFNSVRAIIEIDALNFFNYSPVAFEKIDSRLKEELRQETTYNKLSRRKKLKNKVKEI